MAAHPILDFWFGSIDVNGSVALKVRKRWWSKSQSFDALCRETFASELAACRAGSRESLRDTAEGCLAFILLCDQIPRNIYRGKPEAFASDGLALAATQRLIASELDKQLVPVKKSFAYMPLMHSEDEAVQRLSIERFTALKKEGHDSLRIAQRHKAIIDRFGRYPHRNEILGRTSTDEEVAFLQEPGSSF